MPNRSDVCPIEDHDPTYQRRWINNTFRLWLADEQRVQAERIDSEIVVTGDPDAGYQEQIALGSIGQLAVEV